MSTLARALGHVTGTVKGIGREIETLKTLVIFCGAGLFVSLLFMAYGLDLSPGFF